MSQSVQPLTTVERAIALRKVDAFGGVPMEQLTHIASVARDEWCPADTLLFREGDPPGSLYVILEGRILLKRNDEVLAEALPHESLGVWSLFDEHPPRPPAEVAEDTRVIVLERDDFYDVLSEHVEVTRCLIQDLVKRLVELTGLAVKETK
jgi:CRP-like cAMP-binding protein